MRITMGMVMRQYNTNLNNVMNNYNTASQQADTLRKFNKASEDPFSASKAFALRREFIANGNYQTSVEDAKDQLDTAQSVMMSIHKVVSFANSTDCLGAVNGTMNKENRETYANKLREMQKSIIAPANTQFGSSYIFAGSGAGEPPFSVGENGNLLYRGIDVDTGKIEAGPTVSYNGAQITFGDSNLNDFKVQVNTSKGASPSISVNPGSKEVTFTLPEGATNSDIRELLKQNPSISGYDLSKADLKGDLNRPVDTSPQTEKAIDNVGTKGLEGLANEPSYVDMGLGLDFNDKGEINDQSVFDGGIPGVSFLGYGTKDGISNNLYNLMGQIADKLDSDDFSMDEIQPYLDRLDEKVDDLMGITTQVGTKTNFLDATKGNLVKMGDTVNKKLVETEYVDFFEAFRNFTMQKFAYEKAVKIGADIIRPSFIDFMK